MLIRLMMCLLVMRVLSYSIRLLLGPLCIRLIELIISIDLIIDYIRYQLIIRQIYVHRFTDDPKSSNLKDAQYNYTQKFLKIFVLVWRATVQMFFKCMKICALLVLPLLLLLLGLIFVSHGNWPIAQNAHAAPF